MQSMTGIKTAKRSEPTSLTAIGLNEEKMAKTKNGLAEYGTALNGATYVESGLPQARLIFTLR